ncbi:hypothetical protein RR47_GL000432 [Enterococcus columbae DSM 7374 = ATCC 51263]|nr:hypothetical protein RR47_GL000432 [Enterococcus columbae DSM 7374 = ATCC 51263]
MVQFIHQSYVEKLQLTFECSCCDSIAQAKELLIQKTFSLILLDIQLIDGNGIELLKWVRQQMIDCDIILITAANEMFLAKQALNYGVIDYLIKPFSYERFKQAIDKYLTKQQVFQQQQVDQAKIDQLLQVEQVNEEPTLALEKGLTKTTLATIIQQILLCQDGFTIQDLVEATQLSHVSIRKYILFLEQQHLLKSEMVYLKIGRPYLKYTLIEPNHPLIQNIFK